jgi:HlyD family secretion protein
VKRPSVAAGAIAVALLELAAAGCEPRPETPLATAVRGEFVREANVEGFLKAARSTPLSAPSEAQSAMRVSWLATNGTRVAAGEVVARFDETEWTRELADAFGKRTGVGLKSTKQRIQAESAESGANLDSEVARQELAVAERFQVNDELYASRHELAESALDAGLARSRDVHAQGIRSVLGRVASGEASLLAIESRQAELQIARARSGLAALALAAPHAGLVVFLRDWRGNTTRVGDSVWPGQAIAEIPDLTEMECEVYVLEADAGGLAVGQKARVVLEAHPEVDYEGEVRRVDTIAKPRMRGVPVQFFGATVRLARTDPERMKPGQRARARIEIDRRQDVLQIPAAAVFNRAGKSFVRRRSDAGFEVVPVEIAATGGGLVVIAAGLEAGDEVALADPEWSGGARPEPEPGGTGGRP